MEISTSPLTDETHRPRTSLRPGRLLNGDRGPQWPIQAVLLAAVVAPLVMFFVWGHEWADRQLKEQVLVRRQAVAKLAAANLRARFDRYMSVAEAFTGQKAFRDAVALGRWDEALGLLGGAAAEVPVVDRMFIVDASGALVADTHGSTAGRQVDPAVGELAARAIREGEPRVSPAYARDSRPAVNVFAVAAPVRSDDGAVGAAVMEIRTDALLDVVAGLDVGLDGVAYFIDGAGNLAVHPAYAPQGPLLDVGDPDLVSRTRRGRGGVELTRQGPDATETIIAFEVVAEHGWTAVVSQPTASAFAPAGEQLRFMSYAFAAVLAVNLLLALGILRMLRAYRDSSQESKALLESAGEGIVAVDRHGAVIKMNGQAERLLGWRLREVFGRPFNDVVDMQDEKGAAVPLTFRPLVYALKEGEKRSTSTTPTFYYVRKDGTRFPAAVTASPVLRSGTIVGGVVVIRDISAEKEIDRAKSEFVSLASHQLLSPLSAVKGYAHLFLEGIYGDVGSEQRRTARAMLELVERMINLVDALLNVSRIELGTFSVMPEPTDVREVADNVLFELAPQIERKRVKVAKTFAADVPIVNADPNLVRIVFQNLLTNAIRYSPEGATIAVGIEKRPSVLYMTVADQGIGIPRAQQPKIFDKFFRADNARIKVPDGNGLGLYIARSIIDHAGGRIWFSSEEGKGTTFKVTLPLEGMAPREGTKKLGYHE